MKPTVSLSPEDVLVRAMPTPNPYALKFVVNQAVKNEGKATFNTGEECVEIPLAYSLFQILGVKQIHFFKNTITVTYDGQLEEDDLIEQATVVIRTRIPIHNADFEFNDQSPLKKIQKDRSGLSEEMAKIEEILDRTIRPGLQADGGDIEVISLEDNLLKVLYQGACGGCPSAMMGTLDAIQGILRQELENDNLLVTPL